MRVFSNSAMSADGKIATAAHDHVAVGSAEDRRFMHVLRAQADAVLVGGKTFRNWPLPLIEDPARVHPDESTRQRVRPMLNAVLTGRGICDARPIRPRWPDPKVELVVFGPPELDVQAHVDAFGARVCTRAQPDVAWVLDSLESMGCSSVLVEGGGAMIAAVLATGRLTELFITVAPKLIGGSGAPTPLDGPGLPADRIVDLTLRSLRRVDDELFLHYEVRGREGLL